MSSKKLCEESTLNKTLNSHESINKEARINLLETHEDSSEELYFNDLSSFENKSVSPNIEIAEMEEFTIHVETNQDKPKITGMEEISILVGANQDKPKIAKMGEFSIPVEINQDKPDLVLLNKKRKKKANETI